MVLVYVDTTEEYTTESHTIGEIIFNHEPPTPLPTHRDRASTGRRQTQNRTGADFRGGARQKERVFNVTKHTLHKK